MCIQNICNFITTFNGEKSVVQTFDLKTDDELSTIRKTIRSAITRFHLTTATPIAASYTVKKKLELKKFNEIVHNVNFWQVVRKTAALAALVFAGFFLIKTFTVFSYHQAEQKAASGRYFVIDGQGLRRQATADDFMDSPNSIVIQLAFAGTLLVIRAAVDIYDDIKKICFTNSYEIKVRFEKDERSLPDDLANQEAENQTAYIDPITFEDIPKNEIRDYRYLHPTKYVVDASSCMKAILQNDLMTDRLGLKQTEHPIDKGEMESNSRIEFENEICKTFGFEHIDELYQCWDVDVYEDELRAKLTLDNLSSEHPISPQSIASLNTEDPALAIAFVNAQKELTQRKRELNFLDLFDESQYKLFPAFEPLKESENYLIR